MADHAVSEATVGRLPAYLKALIDLAAAEEASVSSERLSGLVGANSATLRRDLSSLGITGTRGVGYDVKYLVFEIGVILGVNQEWPVVVVGAGNLGTALANYKGLATRGFPVRALLDTDRAKVGTVIGGLVVEHLDELGGLVRERRVTVAVLATPVSAAQEVAELLVDAGIQSILNFTAEPIVVPDHIVVRRVDLATELQILSFYQQRDTAVTGGAGVPLAR